MTLHLLLGASGLPHHVIWQPPGCCHEFGCNVWPCFFLWFSVNFSFVWSHVMASVCHLQLTIIPFPCVIRNLLTYLKLRCRFRMMAPNLMVPWPCILVRPACPIMSSGSPQMAHHVEWQPPSGCPPTASCQWVCCDQLCTTSQWSHSGMSCVGVVLPSLDEHQVCYVDCQGCHFPKQL